MNKLFQIAAILALSAFFVTACSQPSQQPTTGSTNSAQTAANSSSNSAVNTSAKNLCDLLLMAEVSKLAGTTFTQTKHMVDNSQNPYITDCFYSNDQGYSAGIIANYDSPSSTAKEQYQIVLDYQKEQEKEFPSQKISGVGDKAFMPSTGILSQINALKGNVWITVSVYTGSKTGEKDHAIAIAKRAFEVL